MPTKGKRVWWLVGLLTVVLVLFAVSAVALSDQEPSYITEASVLLEARGFTRSSDDLTMLHSSPGDVAVRFTGAYMDLSNGEMLADELRLGEYSWGYGGMMSSSGGRSDVWQIDAGGSDSGKSAKFAISSEVTDGEERPTFIEITAQQVTLVDRVKQWLGIR